MYEYHRPTTLEQAWELAAAAPRARFVAGGTDLMVKIKKRAVAPPALISLRNIPELREIEVGEKIRIGAGVPFAEIAGHAEVGEKLPALARALRVLGTPQIRNVATIGGNIGNASPCADTAPPLLVYDATVEIGGSGGRREVALGDFFSGPKETVLEPGEIVIAVSVPHPSANARATFLSKGRVATDLSLASLALLVEVAGTKCTRARVAAGAVAPTPLRLGAVEELLTGAAMDDAGVIARARALAMESVVPITDVRSTAEYRRHLIGVFLGRAIAEVA